MTIELGLSGSDPLAPQPGTPTEIEEALLELPSVAECAVVSRASGAESAWLAYVVPVGPFARAKAETHLAARGQRLPDAYVLVSNLPRTAAGALDRDALFQVPVVDAELAARFETELLTAGRIARAAVFAEELPRQAGALHLAQLLPPGTRRSAGAGAAQPGTPAAEAGVAAGEPEEIGAQAGQRPLAVSVGAPLMRPDHAPQTLPAMLQDAAQRFPGPRITYLANDGSTREQSFEELARDASRVARGLSGRGLQPGAHVLLQLSDAYDILLGFWGCLLGGFVPAITPVPPSYATTTNDLERLHHVIELLERPAIITTERLANDIGPLKAHTGLPDERVHVLAELAAHEAGDIQHGRAPDDVAFLVFTSGSTGAPKIIMLSHRNILTRAEGTNRLCKHEESDRILNWLPFDHIGSISDWHLRCIDLGCYMVYCAKEYVLGDPLNWLRLMDRYRITHSWAPNFAYALVNDALGHSHESWDLSCMKALLTAGEAVSSQTVRDFLKRLESQRLPATACRPAFGMAELGSGVTYFQPTAEHPVRVLSVDRAHLDGPLRRIDASHARAMSFTSLGPVIPGASIRIVDDALQPLPELSIGRLHIAGGPVTLGYFKNPDANREVFVGDGWFNTGDRGFIADGELYLTGRDKESLIINGANFHNSEIEAAVEEVDGVDVSFTAACAVRPAGDPEERLVIFFCPPPGVTGSQLKDLLRRIQNGISRKTGTKPDYLLPVDRHTIPKTAIGKIQRKQLTKRFEAGEFTELERRVDVLLGNDRTLPDWFARLAWQARALSGVTQRIDSCLILDDRHGLAAELERVLEARGVAVSRRSPDAPSPSERDFAHVVDLADFAPVTHDGAERAAAGAAERVAALSGRLLRFGNPDHSASTRRYLSVAAGSVALAHGEPLTPQRSLAAPVLKAFAQEVAGVACQHLDLAFAEDLATLHELATSIANELAGPARDAEVAYRHGTRFIPGFARVEWSDPNQRHSRLKPNGFYLLTGGLGGVGGRLSRYLLREWGARLLILGRGSVASGSAADGDPKAELLAELRGLGAVRYASVDIGDANELARVVAEAEAAFGQSLEGAFHLAGVYGEFPVAEASIEKLASVFGPKLDGALALHRLLPERPHAFVVAFSSLAAVFSGGSLAAYAAANRYLDALAQLERSHGRHSFSLDFSVWQGAGIGADAAPAELLRAKGYFPLQEQQGLLSLVALLSSEADQYLVGVDATNANLRRSVALPPEALVGLRGVFSWRDPAEIDAATPAPADLRDRFGTSTPSDLWQLARPPLDEAGELDREAVLLLLRGATQAIVPPRTPLEQKLVAIWKDVLGIEQLGVKESFFDVGGTSLLSVRLFAEIERRIGPSLPPATLFQAASVEALAALIGDDGADSADSELVALNAPKTGPSLFLVHDDSGEVDRYRALAAKLEPKLAVYGLKPHARERFPVVHTRFASMVTHYLGKIRETQPHGPYLLGGADVGGTLAFEIACELARGGEKVALVALLDAPELEARGGTFARVKKSLSALVARSQASDVHLDASALKRTLERHGKLAIDALRVRLLRRYEERGENAPWYLEYIPPAAVFRFAEAEHRASFFDGELALYRASAAAPDRDDDVPMRELVTDDRLGWNARATQPLVIADVPGGHQSMFDEPNVATLAERLSSAIDRAISA